MRHPFLSLLSALALMTPGLIQAQVIDDFNRTDWTGSAGMGWTGGWARRGSPNSNPDRPSPAINPPTSLWTGNSLQVTPSSNAGVTGANVSRSFESHELLDITKSFTISFQFSIDDLGTFLDSPSNHIYLAQAGAAASFNLSNATNWFIAGFGGTNPSEKVGGTGTLADAFQAQWNIYNESTYLPTGILIQSGTIYNFTIDIDPVQFLYSVSISDGFTDPFQSDLLGFYRTPLQQTLVFGEVFAPGQGAIYSIGNVLIIPEPSTVALILLTGVGVLPLRRRRA